LNALVGGFIDDFDRRLTANAQRLEFSWLEREELCRIFLRLRGDLRKGLGCLPVALLSGELEVGDGRSEGSNRPPIDLVSQSLRRQP
jgi:hypothetical protein